MISLISVGCGGFLGAVARYGVGVLSVAVLGHGFPYATMVVNIVGSLFMGIVIEFLARYGAMSMAVQAFFVTGFLGAFTTFSTFSLDVAVLYERGDWGQALSYALGSVIISILALFVGMYIVRSF